MVVSQISFCKDRVAVYVSDDSVVQFLIKEEIVDKKDCEQQIKLAFAISSNLTDIESHLRNNGHSIELEEIYSTETIF